METNNLLFTSRISPQKLMKIKDVMLSLSKTLFYFILIFFTNIPNPKS